MTVVAFCIVGTDAYCVYVDTFLRLERMELNENLIVNDNGVFSSPHIDVADSVLISNRGIINSDFYFDDVVLVHVQNSGTINGKFHVTPDSYLIQVVQSENDVTHIDVDKNFRVLVQNADNVSLSDVIDIGADAEKITLKNSTLTLNNASQRRLLNTDARPIEIIGDVIFNLGSVDEVNYSVPALHNVSVSGHVLFDVPNFNPLYNVIGYVNNDDLYMMQVRETDYSRIFKNNVGNFLNDLRRNNPDDKLLNAMDNASDIDAINSVMADSVRLNPIKLMAPVRQMHMLDALGGWRYSNIGAVYADADMIFSDSSSVYRANVSVAGAVARNVYAALGGYVGILDVADDINDYSARMYGARLATRFDNGSVVGNLSGGVSRADFIAGYVFDGNGAANDPGGTAGYAIMDIGAYLLRDYGLTIVPFAGLITHYASVLNENDSAFAANCGVDINLSDHDFDILYDYGIRGNVLTDGTQYLGAFIKFSAPGDGMGAELNTAIIHDEHGTGYKIAVSANMMF